MSARTPSEANSGIPLQDRSASSGASPAAMAVSTAAWTSSRYPWATSSTVMPYSLVLLNSSMDFCSHARSVSEVLSCQNVMVIGSGTFAGPSALASAAFATSVVFSSAAVVSAAVVSAAAVPAAVSAVSLLPHAARDIPAKPITAAAISFFFIVPSPLYDNIHPVYGMSCLLAPFIAQ